MAVLGDIVNTARGEGIVAALAGSPTGVPYLVLLLKERDEISGDPVYWQIPQTECSPGRSHPTYTVGQRVAYYGRGAEITAISGDLTITLRIDQPPLGESWVTRESTAKLPRWRLTMIEEFQN